MPPICLQTPEKQPEHAISIVAQQLAVRSVQKSSRPCEGYWQEAGRIPLLIRADGRIAGFVLLNQWSALDRPVDRAVAEFFVLRKYRRAHVGARAAHLVFHRYPGQWEVPVADYNRAALQFWREVLHSLGVGEIAEYTGDGRRWSGTVLCFEAGPTA